LSKANKTISVTEVVAEAANVKILRKLPVMDPTLALDKTAEI
jgi:hypothetical protein